MSFFFWDFTYSGSHIKLRKCSRDCAGELSGILEVTRGNRGQMRIFARPRQEADFPTLCGVCSGHDRSKNRNLVSPHCWIGMCFSGGPDWATETEKKQNGKESEADRKLRPPSSRSDCFMATRGGE